MRLSYLTVILIRGSLYKCDLNAKYNDAGNFELFGECVSFSFFFSLVSTVFRLVFFVASFSYLSCAPWLVLFLELY